MRRKLLSLLSMALLAMVVTVSGGASPAQASSGWQTTPPQNCTFNRLQDGGVLIGGYTDCGREMGLHRAVVQCADGTTVYGYTEEMDWSRQSMATCGDWFTGYRPAVAAWGEFLLD